MNNDIASMLEYQAKQALDSGRMNLELDARVVVPQIIAALRSPVPEGGRINAVPILQRIRKQRDELADVLRWLDSRGGLGLDVHARIAKALEGIPTYEQQLRNIAEGIGMTYEELMAAASSLPQNGEGEKNGV